MKSQPRQILLIASVLSAALLAACGGGGGDSASPSTSSENAQANKVANTTAPVSASVTPVSGVVGGSGWVSAPPVPLRERNSTPMSDSVAGTSYYVDVMTGNDNNPGTLEAPWKSLKKASAAPLKAGDALLLKCGSVWRDTLDITGATAKEGGFLISGYGDCSGERRPVIRASDWISPDNWTRTADSDAPIYARPWNGATIKRLFADGLPVLAARYPNKSASAEFALATSASSTSQFKLRAADLQALAGRDLIGATIHVRTLLWILDTATVKAFDPATGLVTLDRNLSTAIREGAGYILEGKRWMLDGPNEWFFDASTKELAVWTPTGANPAAGAVGLEAVTRDQGVHLGWVPGVKVERIRTEQQAEDGIHLMDSPGSSIRDVVVSHAYEMGISIGRSSQTTVKDSMIVGAGRRGIVSRDSSDIKITANQVTDTGGFGRTDDSEQAISVYGENALVSGNYIARSASVGIYFQNASGVVVENNTIYQSCLRLGDCAGIHTWTASSSVAPVTTYTPRAQVRNNIIVGAYSNLEGCEQACKNQSTGIYLDEMSAGITVSGNRISAVELGMAIHNGQFNTLESNIVRSASFASIRAIQSRSLAAVFSGNKFLNNSLVSEKDMALVNGLPDNRALVHVFYWFHPSNPQSMYTNGVNQVSGNKVLSSQQVGEATWGLGTWSTYATLQASDWKAVAPTDTIVNPITYRPLVTTLEANLVPNAAFDPALGGWSTHFDPAATGGSFTMGKFAACGSSNCGRHIAASTADQLRTGFFKMNASKDQNLHVFRMTATGGDTDGVRSAAIRRFDSPWENYGLSVKSIPVPAGKTIQFEQFFLAKYADDGVLDLRSSVGATSYTRAVSVNRVKSIEFLNRAAVSTNVINPTATALTFPCVALKLSTCNVIDESGNKVTWPLVIPARSSVFVYAQDTKWKQ